MVPVVATGLGMTEMAGFVTYTGLTNDVDYLVNGVGWPMPITPLSIRRPMRPDGTAGDELPAGETGEICFTGPQVFIAYVGNPEAYRQTVSSEGVCYTGDLGYLNDRGLVLAGRSKLVIKPKGYQVHPAQVEQHFAELETEVAACAAVGQPHDLFGEAVVLFVAPQRGPGVVARQLEAHAQQHCFLHAANALCAPRSRRHAAQPRRKNRLPATQADGGRRGRAAAVARAVGLNR